VRGTSSQIAQIKDLVSKLDGPPEEGTASRGNIRVLPYSGGTASSLLENLELLWPNIRPNKIRVVTASAIGSSLRERTPAKETERQNRRSSPDAKPAPNLPPRQPPMTPAKPEASRDQERSDRASRHAAPRVKLAFASLLDEADESAAEEPAQEKAPAKAKGEQPATEKPAAKQPTPAAKTPAAKPDGEPAEIIISVTPNGLVIASADTAALDDFERLLKSLAESSTASLGNEPTIFWLKYVKADVAAATLNQVVNGVSSGGGSLVGDVASSVVGNIGGGFLSGMLGGGDGASLVSGASSIVPDQRLNCLIVQASPSDLRLIERLLPVIDREGSPEEVQTAGKPRLIPVYYMAADDMAAIVKEVYPDRLAGQAAGGRGGQRQPSPEDFIRAFRAPSAACGAAAIIRLSRNRRRWQSASMHAAIRWSSLPLNRCFRKSRHLSPN